jgi:hypothetical protein
MSLQVYTWLKFLLIACGNRIVQTEAQSKTPFGGISLRLNSGKKASASCALKLYFSNRGAQSAATP